MANLAQQEQNGNNKIYLENSIEKIGEQTLKMEASVFQLANYNFVFQGVILTAVIKGSSSSLKCNLSWMPFCLSLIGAVLNFGTLTITAEKYIDCLNDLDHKTLLLYQIIFPDNTNEQHKKHKKKAVRRKIILQLSLILFFIFSVITLIATVMIPCRS